MSSTELASLDTNTVFSQSVHILEEDVQRLTQPLYEEQDTDTLPSTAGIISRIVLQNFMCHEFFELELGPKINFIIGRNGSGKSAVITGITVGLGCKANEIDRGKNLKNLIKRGSRTAKISITFANRGEEAFEHDIYGDEITIERVLKLDGGGGYYIKLAEGKTILTKKRDLDEILEFFDVSVNNPLAFLSQTNAKTFLANSTHESMYAFLMRGIQFDQIREEYAHTRSRLVEIEAEINSRKEALEALREDERKAAREFEIYNRFKNLRHTKRVIMGRLVWYEAERHKRDISQLKTGKAKAEEMIEEHETRATDTEKRTSELEKKISSFNSQASELQSKIDASAQQMNEVNTKIQRVLQKFQEIEDRIKDLKDEKATKERVIGKLRSKLAIEKKRIESTQGGSSESLSERLSEINSILEAIQSQRGNGMRRLEELREELDAKKQVAREETEDLRNKISELRLNLEQVNRFRSSGVSAFGSSMERLIQMVKQERRFHNKPLGPLGQHMFLKEGFEEFSPILEKLLPTEAFVVQDIHDQRLLSGIMNRCKQSCRIFIRKNERIDYERSLTDLRKANLTRVLDVLDFDNEDAKCAVVDFVGIEHIVLERNANRGHDIVNNVRKVKACFCLQNRESARRFSVNPVTGAFRADPFFYGRVGMPKIRPAGNTAGAIERQMAQLKVALETTKADLAEKDQSFEIQLSGLRKQISEAQGRVDSYLRKMESLRSEASRVRRKLDEGDQVSKIESYTEEIEGVKQELSVVETALQGAHNEIESLRKETATVGEEKKSVMHFKRTLEEKRALFLAEAEQAQDLKQDLEEEVRVIRDALSQRRRLITQIKEKIAQKEIEVVTLEEKAVKYCTFEEAGEDLAKENKELLKKQLDAINAEIERSNSTMSKSLEEIVRNAEVTLERFKKARTEVSKAVDLKNRLQKSLRNRHENAMIMREMLCAGASQDFSNSLALRGFDGMLKFDHKAQTVHMLMSKNGGPHRDVLALSGGEKSFAQISLLLAIWKIMKPKVKGLDEFDVFMDGVNRRISMRLISNNLGLSPKYQTLFITPLDVSHVGGLLDADVRIHKLKDPERANNSSNN